MQLHRLILVLTIICVPIFLSGQNILSLSGGISHSQLPIYTQKSSTRLLSSQALYKLNFAFAFQHRLNRHFYADIGFEYKNLGTNSLNQNFDQEGLFLNSVSRHYLVINYIPKGEIQFTNLTVSLGIGASIGYAINDKMENYLLIDQAPAFFDTEELNLKKLDSGLVVQCELKRMIGNGLNLFLLIEQYQGLVNVNLDQESSNKIYMSNSTLRIGLKIPLAKK